MISPVAVIALLAGATLALLSLAAVVCWIVRRAKGQRSDDFDWGATWRGAMDEFKAAGRDKPPAE